MKSPAEYKGDQDPIGFDGSRVVHTFSASDNKWTATEDCYICGFLYYSASMGANNAYVIVGRVSVGSAYLRVGGTYYDDIGTVCAPVRKGQTILVSSSDYSQIKCYGK